MSKMTTIKFDGDSREVSGGLMEVKELYQEFGVKPSEKCLYLDKQDDIDIPLLPDDRIVIHGAEVIVSGDINPDIGDNPPLRVPVHIKFNGDKVKEGIETAKATGERICQMDDKLESPRLFADLEGKVDQLIDDKLTLVIQERDSYFTIPKSDDDSVDLEECSKGGHRVPKGQEKYRIRIDGEKHTVDQSEMTGKEILQLVDKSYEQWSINQKLHGGRRALVDPDAVVDFTEPGIERFETVMKQANQG